jgi:pantoate--beta-alanine ligase
MDSEVIDTIAGVRTRVAEARKQRKAIGFVPTMGALHAGHASLIEHARRDCGFVVVSIFVNPLQFDRPDDFARYPRTLNEDLELCGALGVDVVFAPSVAEMYPTEPVCAVDVGVLADHLCGRYRPGHFRGVATVVLKLLHVCGPDVAYFGEKDAQQLAVVRRLVSDLNVPVRIAGVATVREHDGLALSSRNRRLSAEERGKATALYRAILAAQSQIEGGITDAAEIKRFAQAGVPSSDGLSVEYLEIVEPDTFQPVGRVNGPVIVAGAMWVGKTRLIDNVPCEPPVLSERSESKGADSQGAGNP